MLGQSATNTRLCERNIDTCDSCDLVEENFLCTRHAVVLADSSKFVTISKKSGLAGRQSRVVKVPCRSR